MKLNPALPKHWKQLGPDLWADAEYRIASTHYAEPGETWLFIHQGSSNLIVCNWREGDPGMQSGYESHSNLKAGYGAAVER